MDDGNSKVLGVPKGQCPKHGTVETFIVTELVNAVAYAELKLCPKCYMEFLGANVTAVTDLNTGETNG